MENENENMIMTTQRMIASIIEQSVDRESRESEGRGEALESEESGEALESEESGESEERGCT